MPITALSPGASAYQIAVARGFAGTEADWLASLHGTAGESAYEAAVAGGFVGDEASWIASLKGDPGPPSVGLTTITADKNQGLRWIGDAGPQLLFRRNKEAILNDRDSIDKTGATALGGTINTYLAEYVSLGISRVYVESGTYGVGATPITYPVVGGFTIEGQNEQGAQPHATVFRALAGCPKVVFFGAGANGILRSVQVNQNNIAPLGIHLDLSSPEIGYVRVVGTPDGGTAIYGGGCENIWLHHYSITITGGPLGIGTGVDIIQGNSSSTGTYYGADNNSLIEKGSVVGNGLLLRVSGNIRVRGHDFEGKQRVVIPGRVILGQDIAGPNGTGLATTGLVRFEDNYFELEALESDYSSLVPVGVYLATDTRAHITGNTIYGASNYFTPGSGTAAIACQSVLTGALITSNTLAKWDIGIKGPAMHNGTDGHGLVAGNYNSCNIPSSGGQYKTVSVGNERSAPWYFQSSDGHLFNGGAIAQAVYTPNNDSGTTVDFARANQTTIPYTTARTLTPANARAGHRQTLRFTASAATLPTASWNLLSGVDETPPVGAVKEFFVDSGGVVRELGPRAKPPATKTATFTADASADTYLCDATSGAITANLPTAATWTGGPLTVKKTDASANAVTVDPFSTQTVDGATTLALTAQWSAVTVRPSGGNWVVTGKV